MWSGQMFCVRRVVGTCSMRNPLKALQETSIARKNDNFDRQKVQTRFHRSRPRLYRAVASGTLKTDDRGQSGNAVQIERNGMTEAGVPKVQCPKMHLQK
ncbi:hypothetical protein L596_016809 [Steinernema carpocapsae]|uniref:Uncharacterized protein n=1 Tax=Steinernema carpocapsae TaxID=34508 RepID=A0A4U5NJ31_STECR|nr:hypothetical protein L596_016809 [Steinernema carpocapsae]